MQKKGDVVEHKIIPGKMVIVSVFNEDPSFGYAPNQPDYRVRKEDGGMLDIYKEEIK